MQDRIFRIRSIAKSRRYLYHSSTETIVHTFRTSRLDYCNALRYGLPKYLIDRLSFYRTQKLALLLWLDGRNVSHQY